MHICKKFFPLRGSLRYYSGRKPHFGQIVTFPVEINRRFRRCVSYYILIKL
nr:MAG TPA: hypothetical protein [Microviridae sp.]